MLATGNVVESARQLQRLVEHGGLVLLKEVTEPFRVVLHAPRGQLPAVWSPTRQHVTQLLASAAEPQFEKRMQAALPLVQTLVERGPDLAIFQIIRQGTAERVVYGSLQAIQISALAMMLANRLGWMGGVIDLAAKCALTMNLSILESMSPVFLQSEQKKSSDAQSRDLPGRWYHGR